MQSIGGSEGHRKRAEGDTVLVRALCEADDPYQPGE